MKIAGHGMAVLLLALCVGGCAGGRPAVVVYCSLDQVFAEPILKGFEQETGIAVKAVYDVEAAKTTGLVNRLIAEQRHPQADVFWNSEIVRTIVLKHHGLLAPYVSKNAAEIPARFKDAQGYWAGFAARARVLIIHQDLVAESKRPRSIFELSRPQWRGRVALANPLFGTTATHVASLLTLLGPDKTRQFFQDLKANGVVMVEGNSTARDLVQEAALPAAFTDTDDANVAVINGKRVAVVYPDQDEGQIGTLLIPNTACLIRGSPHPQQGRRLIDYLLSKETERRLAFASSAQMPLRHDVPRPPGMLSNQQLRTMDVDFEEVARRLSDAAKLTEEIFIR